MDWKHVFVIFEQLSALLVTFYCVYDVTENRKKVDFWNDTQQTSLCYREHEFWLYTFYQIEIQLSNHVKINIIGAFNKKLLFFIFTFLNFLNKNLYKNIVLCNTFLMIPNLLKLADWLNNDIENKSSVIFFESDWLN